MKHLIIIFLIPALSNEASAFSALEPAGSLGVEGNSYTFVPFTLQREGLPSVRYQQVYSGSDFLACAPEGGYINRILFRPDGNRDIGQGNGSGLLRDVQINLSTTAKSADSLSPVFAQNVGTDDTVIHARGSLTWIATRTGGGDGKQPFVVGALEIVPVRPF